MVLIWLRGNWLQSKLAVLFEVSQASVLRLIRFLVPVLACLHANEIPDSKEEFLLDGTLITVADHGVANFTGKHQRQVNVQVVCDAGKRMVFVGDALLGSRHDVRAARESVPVGPKYKTDGAYKSFPSVVLPPKSGRARWRHNGVRVRVEQVIGHLKSWRTLRFCRVRGLVDEVVQAVAFLYYLKFDLVKLTVDGLTFE